MKAIILVGGQGKRLRDAVRDVPKPMAPVGGRPFLEYLIYQLKKWGINDIILSTGYKSEVVSSYFGDGHNWGANIDYSHEKEPLGTGGAIMQAMNKFKDENFIVMNGDSFLDVNFDRLTYVHYKRHALATLSVIFKEEPKRYGHVEIDDNSSIITRFKEKGEDSRGFINGGVYFFNRRVFESVYRPIDGASPNVSLEEHILPSLIRHGLYACIVEGFFVDIGTPDDYYGLCDNHERIASRVFG